METSGSNRFPIVFYDGVCGVCDRTVTFCVNRDPCGRILYAPLQGETAVGMITSEDITSLKSVVYVDETGSFRHSAAVVRILWTLGGIWKLLGWLLWAIPFPIRDLGYRIFGSVRYRIFGKKETCSIPTPEERARFLP